jgi:hypothetical protein
MNLKAGLVWDFDRDNYIHDLARNGTYEIESDTPRNIKIYQTVKISWFFFLSSL